MLFSHTQRRKGFSFSLILFLHPIFTRMHFPESLRGQEDPSQRAFPCCGQVLGLEGLEAEKLTRNVGPSFSVSPVKDRSHRALQIELP